MEDDNHVGARFVKSFPSSLRPTSLFGDVGCRVASFPVDAVVFLHDDLGCIVSKVHACECDGHAVRVGSGRIEWQDSAGSTESALGGAGPPFIWNRFLLPLTLANFQVLGGNDEVYVSAHSTIRTIAIPYGNRVSIATKACPNRAAMAL